MKKIIREFLEYQGFKKKKIDNYLKKEIKWQKPMLPKINPELETERGDGEL